MNKHDYNDERGFEVTKNVRGFMHQLNEISQAFIEFAPLAPGLVVDMGAAYGIATIPILQKHIEVIACDSEQSHLDELKKRIDPELQTFLQTKVGYFPGDFDFGDKTVGAILLSHILPFLTPQELDLAFEKLARWMAPKGKVFIVTYSPYLAPMKDFIPIYEKKVASGDKWPGWIENNMRDYFRGPKDVSEHLPATMHYLDLASLKRALESQSFLFERATYLDAKKSNIPQGILLDGREWCGVIAIKK